MRIIKSFFGGLLIGVAIGLGCYIVGLLTNIIRLIDKSFFNKNLPDLPYSEHSITDYRRSIIAFTDWSHLQFALMIAGIILLIIVILIIKNKIQSRRHDERNFDVSKKGTYGTAKYLSEKQAKKLLTANKKHNLLSICHELSQDDKGIILGTIKGRKIVLKNSIPKENMNMIVCGAPGSGKSYMFVRPYLAQCIRREESFVVTDPSGELLESMGGYAKQCGYKVRVFNLVDPEKSDGWNVTKDIIAKNGPDQYLAQIAASTIIRNTVLGEHSDPFWDNGEQNLLKSLLLYITSDSYQSKDKSLGSMYSLLATKNFSERILGELETLPSDHPAKMPYNIFAQATTTVQVSFASGLATRLQIFQSKTIRDMTSNDDIDLAAPGKEKCAYFIIMSDQDSTYQLLSSLFFSFMFIKLANLGRNCSGQSLPVRVNMVLDELPSIGVIPDLGRKMATVRKYGVNVIPIIQLISQLDNRYSPEEREEIMGCCDTQIWLGSTDKTSADTLSERSGTMTVEVDSKTEKLELLSQKQLTSSVGKRLVLNYDEVMRQELDELVVVLRGQNILKLNKFPFDAHPDFKTIIKADVISVSNYQPVHSQDNQQQESRKQTQTQERPPDQSEELPNRSEKPQKGKQKKTNEKERNTEEENPKSTKRGSSDGISKQSKTGHTPKNPIKKDSEDNAVSSKQSKNDNSRNTGYPQPAKEHSSPTLAGQSNAASPSGRNKAADSSSPQSSPNPTENKDNAPRGRKKTTGFKENIGFSFELNEEE